MADDTFIFEVVLSGMEEAERQLTNFAKSGTASFAELEKAAEVAGSQVGRFANSLRQVQGAFNNVQTGIRQSATAFRDLGNSYGQFETALRSTVRTATVFTGVLTGAAAAVVAFGVSSIRAADDIKDQADAIGLSTERYQQLQFVTAEVGVSQKQFASAFAGFSRQVTDNARAGAKALADFSEKAQPKKSANVFDVSDFTKNFDVIRQGAQKVQADLAAIGINRPLASVTEELTKLANGTAGAQAEFERLTGLTLKSASAGLQKLREQADQGKTALERLGVQVKFNEDGTVNMEKALADTADAFKNIQDPARQTAIAIQLFGRNVGPKMAALLRKGSEGLNEFNEELKNIFLSSKELNQGDAGAVALAKLSAAASAARIRLGLVFEPVVTTAANALFKIIKDNQGAFVDLANTIQTTVLPYVEAFFDALTGEENVTEAGERISEIRGGR